MKALRTRIRDLTEKMRQEEKNFKKQQEHITVLEQKYKEVCSKLGISANIDDLVKIRSAAAVESKKNELAEKKMKAKSKEAEEDDENLEVL